MFCEHCTDTVPAWTGGRRDAAADDPQRALEAHLLARRCRRSSSTSRRSARTARPCRRPGSTPRSATACTARVLRATGTPTGSRRASRTPPRQGRSRRLGAAACDPPTTFRWNLAARAQPAGRGARRDRANRPGRGSGSVVPCSARPPPALDRPRRRKRVIAAAIERGIRFFDVAPLYGGGAGRGAPRPRAARGSPRDEYVLCTKTGVTRPYGQTALPPGGTRRRAVRRVGLQCARHARVGQTSLDRLRTDRLDVVHLHDAEDHLDALPRSARRARCGCASKAASAPSASART